MSTLAQITQAQANKETSINENFDAVSPAALFGINEVTTAALTWGYYGGILAVDNVLTTIANGTLALAASNTNYVEATRAGVVSSNTSGFTAGRYPLYIVVTGSSGITSWVDQRQVLNQRYNSGPHTETGTTYTVGADDQTVINNGSATLTLTLPTASNCKGRKLRVLTYVAFTTVSNASNVVPITGGAAGTGILAATGGKWADLESDGSNWLITASN